MKSEKYVKWKDDEEFTNWFVENMGAFYQQAKEFKYNSTLSKNAMYDVEDLVSEIYLKLITNYKSYDPNYSKPITYSMEIAKNCLNDILSNSKAKKRTADVMSFDATIVNTEMSIGDMKIENDGIHPIQQTPEDELMLKEEVQFYTVDGPRDFLTPEMKQIYISKISMDMSLKDIANVMGMSVSSATLKFKQAKNILKTEGYKLGFKERK